MKLLRLVTLLIISCAQGQTLFEVKTPFVGQKRWALVIGVSKYAEFGSLSFPAVDARDFSKALIEAYGFQAENVKLITDDDALKQTPTASTVLGELDRILADRSLERGDLFVFYFSGHGLGTSKGDFLLPSDAKKTNAEQVGVPVKDVISRFVKAGLKNVLVICDACRAGQENAFGAELQELGKKANIAVMLGCAPGRRSYEYPSLGHGVFTYQLTKAMRDPALRDEVTGALWASAVAKKVQQEVANYTERDYGLDKQVPAFWGEGSTHDVLVGAYVSPAKITQLAFTEIQKIGKKLDRNGFILYLRAMALAYVTFDKWADAVESYKTLDQLGESTAQDLFGLAVALSAIGRQAESERILERIIREGGDKLAIDQATLTLSPTKTTAEQRRRAAHNIFLANPDWTDAQVYWMTAAYQDPVSPEQRKVILAELVKQFQPNSRISHYFAAFGAYLSDDLRAAMDSMSKAMAIKGDEPSNQDMLVLLYMVSDKLGNEEQVQRVIDIGKRNGTHTNFWLGIETMRLDKKSPSARLAFIRTMLDTEPPADQLLSLIVLAGKSASSLTEAVRKAASKHPFAWEAHLAVWLCGQQAKGFPFPMEAVDPNVAKYGPADLDLRHRIFQNYRDLLRSSEVPEELELKFAREFFRNIQADFAKIGPRWEVWDFVQTLAYDLKRSLQFAQIGRVYMAPHIAKGQGDVRLRELLLEAYLNAGATSDAEKLFKKENWAGPEAKDAPLRWAIYLATIGRNADARTIYATLKPHPKSSLGEMYTALGILLDVRLGKGESVRKAATDFVPHNVVAKQLRALAIADLFQPKEAKLSVAELGELSPVIDGLAKASSSVNHIYRDVHAACLVRLQEVVLYLDKQEPNNSPDDTIASFGREHMGNPLYAKIHFGLEPKLSDYVGEQVLTGLLWMDDQREPFPAKITIKVESNGKALLLLDSVGKKSYSGTVDAFGSFVGGAVGNDGKVTVTCKIAPVGHVTENTKETPQSIAFVTEKATYAEFVGK